MAWYRDHNSVHACACIITCQVPCHAWREGWVPSLALFQPLSCLSMGLCAANQKAEQCNTAGGGASAQVWHCLALQVCHSLRPLLQQQRHVKLTVSVGAACAIAAVVVAMMLPWTGHHPCMCRRFAWYVPAHCITQRH